MLDKVSRERLEDHGLNILHLLCIRNASDTKCFASLTKLFVQLSNQPIILQHHDGVNHANSLQELKVTFTSEWGENVNFSWCQTGWFKYKFPGIFSRWWLVILGFELTTHRSELPIPLPFSLLSPHFLFLLRTFGKWQPFFRTHTLYRFHNRQRYSLHFFTSFLWQIWGDWVKTVSQFPGCGLADSRLRNDGCTVMYQHPGSIDELIAVCLKPCRSVTHSKSKMSHFICLSNTTGYHDKWAHPHALSHQRQNLLYCKGWMICYFCIFLIRFFVLQIVPICLEALKCHNYTTSTHFFI